MHIANGSFTRCECVFIIFREISCEVVTAVSQGLILLYQRRGWQNTRTEVVPARRQSWTKSFSCEGILIRNDSICQSAVVGWHLRLLRPLIILLIIDLNQVLLFYSSSGACRRRSRCHEVPPCRSVLSAPLRRRHSEVHWSQVNLHCSRPGLSGTANPSSPIMRRTHNAACRI